MRFQAKKTSNLKSRAAENKLKNTKVNKNIAIHEQLQKPDKEELGE